MSVEKTFIQGARVWIPHVDKGWETAVIVEDATEEQSQFVVQTDDSKETKILLIETKAEQPVLCHPQDGQLDKNDNLSSLTVIHEATISDVLRTRFEQRCLYNNCGFILIALNPFEKQLASSADEILKYHEQTVADRPQAHTFSVAEKAYENLRRESKNQSIVFSGETGSGKTENTKLAILYLSTIDAKATKIKEKILASLTVLEAFGHAKTEKNDNSSRFGKFFELQYNSNYNIVGANLKTYLLGISRVVSQPRHEQNFHIFYGLNSVKARFPFLQLSEREFRYFNAGNPLKTDDEKNSESFDQIVSALEILGFSSKEQDEIWRILAAILHLGNISFRRLAGSEANDNLESCLISNLHGLKNLANLFSLDQKALQPLRKWLCRRRIIVSQQDEIVQPMSVDLAMRNRDYLAQFLYKKLFNFIVAQINATLRSSSNVQSFIGLLDMYGFENLDSNSFEQFCINYANEKIQQYCVQTIFKTKQELELIADAKGLNFSQFHDNVLCLELIEGAGGIIEIVDEETKKYVQTTKDLHHSWILQLHTSCEKFKHFRVRQEGSADFMIDHFITSVRYNPKTFMEKNRNTAIKELVEVLKDSKNNLLHKVMSDEYSRYPSAKERKKASFNSSEQNKKSVLLGLRDSLSTLTDKLYKTSPNFIMCIKSNKEKKAWLFDCACVLDQLQAFNITEITKMSALGILKEESYDQFFDRYHCLLLLKKNERTADKLQENCLKILKTYSDVKDFSHIKFGKSSIFLREEDIGQLEELRKRKQQKASMIIQRAFRGYVEVKRYSRLRRATIWVQNHARRCMQLRREEAIHRERAATKIQAFVRGYLTRRWYQRLIRGYTLFKLYACVRVAAIVKRNLQMQMLNVFATLIQSVYRGYVVRRRYAKMRRSAIVVQACYRGYLGRKLAKQLRGDQMKQTNLALKLDDLQLKINCLIEKHLSPEELAEMHHITDNTQCMKAKNQALNRVLFEKIESLKVLRCKPLNTLQEIPKETLDETEETMQKTPRKIEKNTCELSEFKLKKEDSVQSNGSIVDEVSAAEKEVVQITPEKRQEDNSKSTRITVSSEESKTEDAEEIVQFDAMKAQEASALAYQQTPPKTCIKEKQKICPLPQIDLNLDESCDEVVHCTTLQANEVFKNTLFEGNDANCFIKMRHAYNKFDVLSEVLRRRLNLGDYELMKQKMLNCNSEINIPNISESKLTKLNTFTDIVLDISYKKEPEDHVKNLLVEEKKKYLGMLQFYLKMTTVLVNRLVIDLEVPTILKFNPAMPSIILFMCIRYLDSVNNNHAVILIIHAYKKALEGLMKICVEFDTMILWLSNTHKLLNYLKQYSKIGTYGWEQHHLQNTECQLEYHLRNLDVTLLYNMLHSISVWLFKKALELAEMRVSALLIPGLLENEEIFNFNQINIEQMQRLHMINDLHQLLKELTLIYDKCVKYDLSRSIIIQIFENIFEYISSIALNNFLCRNEFCNNIKGALIRCNIRTIEQWATNQKLTKAIQSLAPIIEAMHLLRLLPFTSAALDVIIGYFKSLNYNQILKIIISYNSPYQLFTFDQQKIVRKLQLKIIDEETLDNTISLNNSDSISLVLPFEYSPILFHEIRIPKEFKLDDILELI